MLLNCCGNVRLGCDYCFNNNIFHLVPYFVKADALSCAFLAVLFEIPIQISFCSVLPVHGVICEMTAPLIELFWIICVFLGAEAHKTIFINVDLEWIDACDHYEDFEVVLVAIDKVWVVNVVAHDVRIQDAALAWHFGVTLKDADAFGILAVDRFADPKARWIELSL